jgi:phosphohistidine phosphatase
MKNLILIRHAKSSWDYPIHDFDRNLTQKGIDNSLKMANEALDFIEKDAVIWSSAAKRALETAKIFVRIWSYNSENIEVKKELYTFDSIKLEEIVKSCSNQIDYLILFGHNSAITDFVNKFGDIFIENVPTSGFVSITFDTNDWKKINKGKIEKIIFPRDI